MQKRGTPVNRIPIMAKHVLDLYDLYRLVVSKGGLVEVINKKLWREITKGLNLPSSITSAAFTLRTQYMKYLYPYECEKLKLSTMAELQSAIDGNRREGRRPVYNFEYSSPNPLNTSSSISGNCGGNGSSSHNIQSHIHQKSENQQHQQIPFQPPPAPHLFGPQTAQHHAAFLAAAAAVAASHHQQQQQHQLPFDHHNHNLNPNSHHLPGLSDPTSMNLSPFLKSYFEMNTPPSSTLSSSSSSSASSTSSSSISSKNEPNDHQIENSTKTSEAMQPNFNHNNKSIKRPFESLDQNSVNCKENPNNVKKMSLDLSLNSKNSSHSSSNSLSFSSTNSSESSNSNLSSLASKMKIKIMSKDDFDHDETNHHHDGNGKSMQISIEYNGQTYQGTLFANRDTLTRTNHLNIHVPFANNNNTESKAKTDLIF
jgi:hypothetical protein